MCPSTSFSKQGKIFYGTLSKQTLNMSQPLFVFPVSQAFTCPCVCIPLCSVLPDLRPRHQHSTEASSTPRLPQAAPLEPPSPTAWPPLICFPSLLFWHLENLIQMESYSRWAFEIGICPTVLFAREFIQVGPCTNCSTLLTGSNIHSLDVPLAKSPIKGHLGYYHIWVIRNKATTQSW